MFWSKQYTPLVLNTDYNKEELLKNLIKNNIELNIENIVEEWAGYAHIYAIEHGFDKILAMSFATMVSSYMTGVACSGGTDIFFDENKIDEMILEKIQKLNVESKDEEVVISRLFDYIFSLYNEHIDEFEPKNHRLGIECLLSLRQYNIWKSVKGERKVDKFRELLRLYSEVFPDD